MIPEASPEIIPMYTGFSAFLWLSMDMGFSVKRSDNFLP